SGDLPLADLPIIAASSKQYSVARFEVEVLTPGRVSLGLNADAGVSAWVDQKPIQTYDEGLVAELPKGVHTITLSIDRKLFKEPAVRVQLLDGKAGSAQTRLRMGR
uniref:hypothetical protein n=1 Tax=Persicitalea sp. TaxID=3100273 RepID=UPI00359450E7